MSTKDETKNGNNGECVIMKEHRARGVALIPVEHLRIVPGFNYRIDFDPVLMESLKKSIMQRGVEIHLKVQPNYENNCYDIRDGERRFRCVKEINKENPGLIPALMCDIIDKSTNEEEALATALVGNQGLPPNKLEMAYVVHRFKKYNWEIPTIAETFSMTTAKVESLYQFWNSTPNYIKEQWLKQEINYAQAMKAIKETPKNIEKKRAAKEAKYEWKKFGQSFLDMILTRMTDAEQDEFDTVIAELQRQFKIKEDKKSEIKEEPNTDVYTGPETDDLDNVNYEDVDEDIEAALDEEI